MACLVVPLTTDTGKAVWGVRCAQGSETVGGLRIPWLAPEMRGGSTHSPCGRRSLNNIRPRRHSSTCVSPLVPLVLTDDDSGKRPAQLQSSWGECKPFEYERSVCCGFIRLAVWYHPVASVKTALCHYGKRLPSVRSEFLRRSVSLSFFFKERSRLLSQCEGRCAWIKLAGRWSIGAISCSAKGFLTKQELRDLWLGCVCCAQCRIAHNCL